MKTAVSIPDGLFKNAEITAQRLGIPRSQLFARALEEFIKNHNKDRITEKLNEVYGKLESLNIEYDPEISLEAIRKSTQHDTW